MKMKCYKCGDSPETGKSFIPVEPAGTPNRKWACTECASKEQKQQAKDDLGESLEVARIFDPNFLNE